MGGAEYTAICAKQHLITAHFSKITIFDTLINFKSGSAFGIRYHVQAMLQAPTLQRAMLTFNSSTKAIKDIEINFWNT